MKKIFALLLCLALVVGCAASLAEENKKHTLGTISINGKFTLQCSLPDGYAVQQLSVNAEQLIATVSSEDKTKPVMVLSVAFDDTYSDVDRMNELDHEELELLEQTFTANDPTVEISYAHTGLGTLLLIARQSLDDLQYVDFLSIYKGYFVEFIMIAGEEAEDKTITDEQVAMCIDFLTEVDFIPAGEETTGVDVAGKEFTAKILDYDAADKTLQVVLLTPVILPEEEVAQLAEGSVLQAGSETYVVETLERTDDHVLINDELYLLPAEGGYKAELYEATVMEEAATMQVPLSDSVKFVDEIDPESLEQLDDPTTHTAQEFVDILVDETANGKVGFEAENVTVSFDENGNLAQITRFYVPWQ